MALKSNGSTFLDDNRNYSATANTVLANDAYILIANNDSVSSDGYSISDTKAIADDGFAFNQFNAEEQVVSFSPPPPPPTQAQGSVSGYTSAGTPFSTTIDKFPFATDGNATDVGDLTQSRGETAGQSSDVSGYTSGGTGPIRFNTIDKFPFATDANATDVGDLTQARKSLTGQMSTASGYSSGGWVPSYVNTIDKFPFAADANATDVGDLPGDLGFGIGGTSSTVSGYTAGGFPSVNRIEKFPFATDANATDVGDLTQGRFGNGGNSENSTENGYASGGAIGPPTSYANTIDKFPFAADANATDVGDLTQAKKVAVSQSSTVSGYASGGIAPPNVNTIEKFPFATDANATDVGDLTQARSTAAGQQV